eukprot:311476-Lingulodinium_polyedra.AAC.1
MIRRERSHYNASAHCRSFASVGYPAPIFQSVRVGCNTDRGLAQRGANSVWHVCSSLSAAFQTPAPVRGGTRTPFLKDGLAKPCCWQRGFV